MKSRTIRAIGIGAVVFAGVAIGALLPFNGGCTEKRQALAEPNATTTQAAAASESVSTATVTESSAVETTKVEGRSASSTTVTHVTAAADTQIEKRVAGSGPTYVLAQATPPAAAASGQTVQLGARSGSKMRIEGTSSLHDWQMESPLIAGKLEVGPNFPMEPGQAATPGKVQAIGEAFVTVASFKSKEKDGSPYSDKMDEIMYEHLDYTNHPKIIFKITDLNLKEAAKDKTSPYVFDAKGDLAIAGVTNSVSFPVEITPLGDNKFKVTGTFATKMSAFKVKPETIGLGIVKTGDDVKLIWTWMLGANPPKSPPTK